MKKHTTIGLVLSISWVLAFAVLMYLKRDSLPDLKLNEWGDFFAGAAAPIALLWLVLGYVQQGEELRQNTEALLGQQRQLENQVRETVALVANAERQAAASEVLAKATQDEMQRALARDNAATQPRFTPHGGRGGGTDCMIDIRNEGASVKRLIVSGPDNATLIIEPTDHFPTGRNGQLVVKGNFSYPFTFEVRFLDTGNRERLQRYEMIKPFEFMLVNEA
jgi:hypothetical protein